MAGRFAFTPFPATVYANLPVGGGLSVSRETNVGVRPTIGVGVGPRVLAPKLSESLINSSAGFNKKVEVDGRNQPDHTVRDSGLRIPHHGLGERYSADATATRASLGKAIVRATRQRLQ